MQIRQSRHVVNNEWVDGVKGVVYVQFEVLLVLHSSHQTSLPIDSPNHDHNVNPGKHLKIIQKKEKKK